MNENLEKLYQIGKKDTRFIIGLMSGTSLDGLDVALCEIRGSGHGTNVRVKNFTTVKYNEAYKNEVRKVFAKKSADIETLTLLNEWIGKQHAGIANRCLEQWQISINAIDLIASHGQTIYHAPEHAHGNSEMGNGTLQIGDGDHIAFHTGIITISDFRQKNIAAGGEGAPLACYGDFLLFAEPDKDVILLNIGGIANFTFLPAGGDFSKVKSSDIGPGNTLMDTYIREHFPGKDVDMDATIALSGNVNQQLLEALQRNDFFHLPYPKTTGPELFDLLFIKHAIEASSSEGLSHQDIMATLNKFTASIIIDTVKQLCAGSNRSKLYISGGGLHNPLLMSTLSNELSSVEVTDTIVKGIDPDAKEAVLFALLANEFVAGNPLNFGKGSPQSPAVSMGKISFPQ